MNAGFAALDDIIARVRGMKDLANEIAKDAAPELEKAVRATAAAGETPEGKDWAPRKKDGGRAMQNAAQHITVQVAGTTIRIVLTGPDVWHHFAEKREPQRRVIPDAGAGMPDYIAAILKRSAERVFERRMGGR